MWSPSESIWVFKQDGGYYGHIGKFESYNSEPALETTFYGVFLQFVDFPSTLSEQCIWAVYPYEKCQFDSQRIFVTTDHRQTACAGSFENKSFPAMAICSLESNTLYFRHICGGICFSVTQTGISSITIRSNGGEPLAGTVSIRPDEAGIPVVDSVIEGFDTVVITAPEGGFQPGCPYYAVLLPQVLSKGFTISLTKDAVYAIGEARREINQGVTIRRGIFGRLTDIDKDLTFPIDPPVIPDGNIVFADSRIKTRLVNAFDTNGDGELSYAEAANVSSLEGALGSIKTYRSFDEFQYFTGVKEIPDDFLRDCTLLTSVTLPSSIRSIGSRAFYGCSSLQTFDFPPYLTRIAIDAFKDCTALTSLTASRLPDNCTIGALFEFKQCNLKRITLAEGISEIPEQSFYYLSSLESIHIPESVTRIGSRAFLNCAGLLSVNLPAGIREIEKEAFYGCASMEDVSLPSEMAALGEKAFYMCSALKHITLPSGVVSIGDECFSGCHNLESVVFTGELNYLGREAFRSCTSLRQVDVPKGFTCILPYTFANCSVLEKVTLPEGIALLDDYAFFKSGILAMPDLPRTIERIGNYCFSGCKRMVTASWPTGQKTIGDSVFYDCSSLTSFTIPDCVESIASCAFYNCINLRNVSFGANLSSIGPTAFYGCNNLEQIILPSSLTTIDRNAFQYCTTLASIRIPEGVTALGNMVFADNTELEEIILPETLSAIPAWMCLRCSKLKSIRTTDSISLIDKEAFLDCSAMETAIISESVSKLGSKAFGNCTALKGIMILRPIPPILDDNAFLNTNGCPVYVPDESLTTYQSQWTDLAGRLKPLSTCPFQI